MQAVNCSFDLENKRLDQARLTCQKLFSPDDPDKLTTLGMLYGQHGDYAHADWRQIAALYAERGTRKRPRSRASGARCAA